MLKIIRRKYCQKEGRILFRVIAIIAVLALLFFLKIKLEKIITEKLDIELKRSIDRSVSVENLKLFLPVKIERIIISSGDEFDKTPLGEVTGITAWPNLLSLLVLNPQIDRINAEQITLIIRKRADGSWNTRGLFPLEPAEKPKINSISTPNMVIYLDNGEKTYQRDFKASIQLGNKGAFSLDFSDSKLKGLLTYSGKKVSPLKFNMKLELDSYVIFDRIKNSRFEAEYLTESGIIDFRLSALISDTAANMSGRISFDSNSIRCDSSIWSFNGTEGRMKLIVDDFKNKFFRFEAAGAINVSAVLLDSKAKAGDLKISKASLSGYFEKEWKISADIKISGLEYTSPLIEDLNFDGTIEGSADKNFVLKPNTSKGRLSFRRALIEKYDVKNADFDFVWSNDNLNLTGAANFSEGKISAKGLDIKLDSLYHPKRAEGKVSIKSVDVSQYGIKVDDLQLFNITGEFFIDFEKRKVWQLQKVSGQMRDMDYSFRGDRGRVIKGTADFSINSRDKFDGKFRGNVEALGGIGDMNLEIGMSKVVYAEIKLSGIRTKRIATVFPSEGSKKAIDFAEKIDLDGKLKAGVQPEEWQYDGSISSSSFKIINDAGRALILPITAEVKCSFSEKNSSVFIDKLKLNSRGTQNEMTILNPFVYDGKKFSNSIAITRLDIDEAVKIAKWLKPDLKISSRNLEGGFKNGQLNIFYNLPEWKIEVKNLDGNFNVNNSPLVLNISSSEISDKGIALLINIENCFPNSIYKWASEESEKVPDKIAEMKGSAGGIVEVVSKTWNDAPDIRATLEFKNFSIDFPTQDISFQGIEGKLPVIWQIGSNISVDSWITGKIHVSKLKYGAFYVTDINTFCGFNEKHLYLDKINYLFAEGHGKAACFVNLEDWQNPKTVIKGTFEDVNSEIVYNTMQPYQGKFEGLANGQFEISMHQHRFDKFDLDFIINDGILGSHLLKMISAQAGNSLAKTVLDSLEVWYYKKMTIKVKLHENSYDLDVLKEKFSDPADWNNRNEFLVDLSIKGQARSPKNRYIGVSNVEGDTAAGRPDHMWIANLLPTNIFLNLLQMNVRIENMPLRFVMNLVGKRLK